MIVDGQIRDEKLQYDVNSEVAEISALSSGKISTRKQTRKTNKNN